MAAVWLGLFTVIASEGNTSPEGNAGACVWIAAQAEDGAKLKTRVDHALGELGLTVIEAEGLQEVDDEDTLSDEQWKLIPEARRNDQSVVCGTWHNFRHHDA